MINQYVTTLDEDSREPRAFDTHRTPNAPYCSPFHQRVFHETRCFICEEVWLEALGKLASLNF